MNLQFYENDPSTRPQTAGISIIFVISITFVTFATFLMLVVFVILAILVIQPRPFQRKNFSRKQTLESPAEICFLFDFQESILDGCFLIWTVLLPGVNPRLMEGQDLPKKPKMEPGSLKQEALDPPRDAKMDPWGNVRHRAAPTCYQDR